MCIFFFNDTATTEIYTLSLHDALPIYPGVSLSDLGIAAPGAVDRRGDHPDRDGLICPDLLDRKSTRLNSSHANISYAVFCLKKNNTTWLCYYFNSVYFVFD